MQVEAFSNRYRRTGTIGAEPRISINRTRGIWRYDAPTRDSAERTFQRLRQKARSSDVR